MPPYDWTRGINHEGKTSHNLLGICRTRAFGGAGHTGVAGASAIRTARRTATGRTTQAGTSRAAAAKATRGWSVHRGGSAGRDAGRDCDDVARRSADRTEERKFPSCGQRRAADDNKFRVRGGADYDRDADGVQQPRLLRLVRVPGEVLGGRVFPELEAKRLGGAG